MYFSTNIGKSIIVANKILSDGSCGLNAGCTKPTLVRNNVVCADVLVSFARHERQAADIGWHVISEAVHMAAYRVPFHTV